MGVQIKSVSKNIHTANSIFSSLKKRRPKTKTQLKNYIKAFLQIDIPEKVICPGHSSPLDYLWHAFNRDFSPKLPDNSDAVIWAGRGGGKTLLAAVATLLDCVFKPNCKIRILGGSEDQAQRMYNYLINFLQQ